MNAGLVLTTGWETLDEGAPEDRACFAELGIQWGDVWLTEGQDNLAGRLRDKPLLSAFRLAEWLASNWWRLRYEPRGDSIGWRFAHRMANIGGGFVWPDITISSDGARTSLVARPSSVESGAHPAFRYLSAESIEVPSDDFERAIDDFLARTIQRLNDRSLRGSDLERVWGQVAAERLQPDFARYRHLEALLGHDPDESADDIVSRLLEDEGVLGLQGLQELAAHAGYTKVPVQSASALRRLDEVVGFTASDGDLPRLHGGSTRGLDPAACPAWRVGAEAARSVRAELGNLGRPLTNSALCALAGMHDSALAATPFIQAPIAFALRSGPARCRVVLRSKRPSGRRFELSRLLGDRLMNPLDPLLPSTRAYTFRQKAQRAFAAELLSPFAEVFERLGGDYSSESQMDVAEQFDVSVLTITTQLVNHKVLGRSDLESPTSAA